MQNNRRKEGLAGKLSSIQDIQESTRLRLWLQPDISSRTKHPCVTYLRPSLSCQTCLCVGADAVQRSSCSYRDMFREGGWMSPQLGKLGSRHRGHFLGKICVCSKQLGGGSRNLCEVTGLGVLTDSCRMSFSVKVNTGARLCLFMQHKTGQTSFSPILLAC